MIQNSEEYKNMYNRKIPLPPGPPAQSPRSVKYTHQLLSVGVYLSFQHCFLFHKQFQHTFLVIHSFLT